MQQLHSPFFILLSRDAKIACLLGFFIIFSALLVIHTKHVIRKTYSQLQMLEKTYQDTTDEWHKALVEHSTWSSNARIHDVATKKLNMYKPNKQQILKP